MSTVIAPQSQDFLVEAGLQGDQNRGNLFVHDIISLNAKLWLLSGDENASNSASEVAKHIVSIVHDGSSYALPSSSTAAESFFTGGGRFLKKDGDSWSEINDNDAVKLLTDLLQEEADFLEKAGYGKEPENPNKESDKEETKASGDDEEEASSPGKSRRDKRMKTNSGEAAAAPAASNEEGYAITKPTMDDVVLIDRKDSSEKTYVDHAGNAFLILEVSQFFTDEYMLSKATIKGTRADAALATVYSLLGPVKDVGLDGTTTTKTRFLMRPQGSVYFRCNKDTTPTVTETWETLNYRQAAEFVLLLLFDKLVDKENIAALLEKPLPAEGTKSGPSTAPVKTFSDHDVLFGRGGLTNMHPGNRRFREIILLYRPDYVRAIKIEKPNVARKIVRAIRHGTPKGRFLKKDPKNGMWYECSDRQASEKTSQALREKTQAEKAAKFDDDKKKRLREGGLSQLASQRGVRNVYPILPLPNLSPADLQRMVQAPYPSQMAGVPVMAPFGVPVAMAPNGVAAGDKGKASAPDSSTGPAAASVADATAAAVSTAAEGNDDLKQAANQDRYDAEGNILVTDSDVISGRGGRSNHHKGNKRFRDMVALHRPDYVRAAKIHKPSVARAIVRALRIADPPGRFLKKDEKTGKWIELSDKKAAEKCSQALREKTQEERDRQKLEVGMPPSYFTNTALFQATAAMIKNSIPGLGSPAPATGAQPGNVAAAPTGAEGQPQPAQGAAAAKPKTDSSPRKSDSSPSKKGKQTAEV